MKIFVTTVAGMSTRFSQGLPSPALKCIYYKKDAKDTLLWRMLALAQDYDQIVVVGGYRFQDLQSYIETYLPKPIRQKTLLVKNSFYEQYGSGWSLLEGLKALRSGRPDEILFAEGDLFLDQASFRAICQCPGDAIAVNRESIQADRSVALYFDQNNRPHYIYDTAHGAFSIPEPFLRIFNSAQVWKFADPPRLFETMDQMLEEEHRKTNLSLINRYYLASPPENLHVLTVAQWINCNTVSDFNQINF